MKLFEAYGEIVVNQSGLSRGLSAAEGKVSKFSTSMKGKLGSIGSSISGGILGGLGIGAGLAAFKGIEGFLSSSVSAAIENEEAQQKLKATLRATGNEVEGNLGKLTQLSQALEENANISHEESQELIAFGLNLGITTDKIGDMTEAAYGLAEATGTDAKTAMEKLVKAQQGSFLSLQRQLPLLKAMKTDEEKLAYVQRISNQGMAERKALTNTLGGSTKQLELATHELAAEVGGVLAPALTKAAQEATKLIKALGGGANKEIADLKDKITDLNQQNLSSVDALIAKQNAAAAAEKQRLNSGNWVNGTRAAGITVAGNLEAGKGLQSHRRAQEEFDRLKDERDQLASGNQSPNKSAQKRLQTIQNRMHQLALSLDSEGSPTQTAIDSSRFDRFRKAARLSANAGQISKERSSFKEDEANKKHDENTDALNKLSQTIKDALRRGGVPAILGG